MEGVWLEWVCQVGHPASGYERVVIVEEEWFGECFFEELCKLGIAFDSIVG